MSFDPRSAIKPFSGPNLNLRANEQGIWSRDTLYAPRESVKEAFLAYDEGRRCSVVRARCEGHTGTLDVYVSSVAEGRAVLRALGHGGAHTTITFPMSTPILGSPWVLRLLWNLWLLELVVAAVATVVVAIYFKGNVPAHFARAAGLVVLVSFVLLLLGGTVSIGGDGLLFKWLGLRRFLPYREILAVQPTYSKGMWASLSTAPSPVGVLLTLANGEYVHLETRRALETYERIDEAVNVWWGGESAIQTAVVERGNRNPRAWLKALKALSTRATATYRTGSMVDGLWRILEDAAAPCDARAGAAVALSPALDTEGRARLLTAARATAEPTLRAAMETAAHESVTEEAFIQALAVIDAPRTALVRRRESDTLDKAPDSSRVWK